MKMKLGLLLTLASLLCCLTAFADDDTWNPWLIRLRAIDVIPVPSSTTINLIGGHVSEVSNQVVPEIDFSYFFTPYIATELILATSRHSPEARHTALGTVDLGKVNVLPPTLTLQYHLFPDQVVSPYIGAGVNFTHFFNVKNGPVANSTKYGNSFGPALQVGADISLDEHWLLNLDVKKVYIKSDVHVNTGLGQLHTNVKLNPIIAGIGIGYRF